MSLTRPMLFDCPYCMAHNEVEVDEMNDLGQAQIVDCQVCCQPIELSVVAQEDRITIVASREDD
ncbi:CPXCG motif-containing cysteine-rich protein [Alteromonas aestuariivivens]|uniref:CPXCG motif-containing cysteine-rich protein n=1 Tax=Alteromonas aestuariivivens TaxID=1938339 RepID=A0A3D8M5S9_9ALTE|nr:CPXCG motif-containing cysteine-rich protein [Alteromonas aestuariivivens]RDV24895.1 CPXCG motif-containing cysteine-rich protein [Alteromonas aestuariivivens]